eukprot:CAMPEP_0181294498 /NCGR_PEP_ID=MMETSP1101-20121128/3637_1 /TAXON_ID=46948 /ORGANISM="Rhodomonas abbreviata, Strain Caron Lab Isolate" /LENGTH=65 /DNA_ID=CAMNT_0023399169 /DNA_START=282 /DNA_END=476 /DNA_ORIENTATION=+
MSLPSENVGVHAGGSSMSIPSPIPAASINSSHSMLIQGLRCISPSLVPAWWRRKSVKALLSAESS